MHLEPFYTNPIVFNGQMLFHSDLADWSITIGVHSMSLGLYLSYTQIMLSDVKFIYRDARVKLSTFIDYLITSKMA